MCKRLFSFVISLALAAAMLSGWVAVGQRAPKGGRKQNSSPPDLANADVIDPELASAIKSAPRADQWPNSNYARLLDLGDVTLKPDGTVVSTFRSTYKLFHSERVRNQLGEVTLYYNASYQSLRVISARTIRKDGIVVPVQPEDLRTANAASGFAMYSDARSVGFSLPALEDESIIDYTYQLTTQPLIMRGQFAGQWFFSAQSPVVLSRYQIHAPAATELNYKAYNSSPEPSITSSRDGASKSYLWELRNLAPIEEEPAMPPFYEIGKWMEVSSVASWQEISQWFWKLAQPETLASDSMRSTVANLIQGKATDDDRARAIYYWVTDHTRYVALEFGLSAYRPHAAAEVFEKEYGDCKDKAILLIAMLGLAGIKASPVLLRPGDYRDFSVYLPGVNSFDHCIVHAMVDGQERWLDATAETCSYGDIPPRDRGVEALVIDDGRGEFKAIPRYEPEENGSRQTEVITLRVDGGVNATLESSLKGGLAQTLRAAFRSLTPEQQKEAMEAVAQNYATGAILEDYKVTEASDRDGAFSFKFSLQAASVARITGESLLVPVENKLSTSNYAHAFFRDKRLWPIEEKYASKVLLQTTFIAPEGFQVADLPENLDLTAPTREFLRKLEKSADGKKVIVNIEYTLHDGKISPSDYPKLKKFLDDIRRHSEDEIVFRKTGAKSAG